MQRWGKVATFGLAAVIATCAAKCYTTPQWSSKEGQLWFHEEHFRLKGVNWFGFENANHVVDGLWGNGSMARYLDFLRDNDFNAIRVPISLSMALNPDVKVAPHTCGPADCAQTLPWKVKAWDMLDRLFAFAAERGILIMLDMHSLAPAGYHDETRWYSDEFTEAQFMQGWSDVVRHYKKHPNLFACDLRNEPHSAMPSPTINESLSSTWGQGNLLTDWNKAAERTMARIMHDNPEYAGLMFVEGVAGFASKTPYDEATQWITHWWGGLLWGVYEHPLDGAEYQDRIVYAPHVYGPGTWPHWYFENMAGFPSDMQWVWDTTVGFVEGVTGHAVALGEWGAVSTPVPVNSRSPDANQNHVSDSLEWQEGLADYLWANCISDTFYWCMNSNSVDTGGLLTDDWRTPDPRKLAVTESVQPYPSSFSKLTADEMCFDSGKPANSDLCRKYSWENRNDVAGPKGARPRDNYYKNHQVQAEVTMELNIQNALVGTIEDQGSDVYWAQDGIRWSLARHFNFPVDRIIIVMYSIASSAGLQEALNQQDQGQGQKARRHRRLTGEEEEQESGAAIAAAAVRRLADPVGVILPHGTAHLKYKLMDRGNDAILAVTRANLREVADAVLGDLQDPAIVKKIPGLKIFKDSTKATINMLSVEDTTPVPTTIDAAELKDGKGSEGEPVWWGDSGGATYSLRSSISLAAIGLAVFGGLMFGHRRKQRAAATGSSR